MPAQTDEERKRLIASVRRRLGDDPHLPDLATAMLAQASMEDLRACSSIEVAAFVRMAGEAITSHRPGAALVAVENPEIEGRSRAHRAVTVVTIANDNMPFLVDSIVAELEDFGAEIRFVVHPVITVARTRGGNLDAILGTAPADPAAGSARESLIQIHIARLADSEERLRLATNLETVLVDVRRAVSDWRAMRVRVEKAIDDYRFAAAGVDEADRDEAIAFLTWMLDDNFTLLGIREYDFVGGRDRGELQRRDIPGLGILSDPDVRVLRRGDQAFTTTPAIRDFLMRPEPIFVTKANTRSRVHRRVYMDYVGIKEYDDQGRLAGELRLIGLFTSTAYNRSTRQIPFLRRKIDRVLELAGFDPAGHSGKALANVLESYPRDELFHIDEDMLTEFSLDILDLLERPRIRVLVRPDEFDRYVSFIVFVPRERYNSDVRAAIGGRLAERFRGHVSAFYPAYPDATTLARVHFIIGRDDGERPAVDPRDLENEVAAIVRTWRDELRLLLSDNVSPAVAEANVRRYAAAFPSSYRDAFRPAEALHDITVFERLTADRPLAAAFHPLDEDDPGVGLKLYHLGAPLGLSERVPILENMGFRVIAEQTYAIAPTDEATRFHVHDMILVAADGRPIDLDASAAPMTDCLMAVWFRQAENDGFNSLTLYAGLPWREVALIRAFGRYLHQTGTPYSQRSMWDALRRYPAMAREVVTLFGSLFDPEAANEAAAETSRAAITEGLEAVETLEDDRVIRLLVDLVEGMLRTNFFQVGEDGEPRAEIVFKFDPRQLEELPEPRPYREIFVYAPRIEGVHLRFGAVARGGLRWSDRPQDFRTEVLGLVKAQQVKNAVIVPVGAKGGFVAKWLDPAGDREAFRAEGQAAYRIFVASMLSITDNLDGDTVLPPPRTVRRDGDDPYLVVAADKGTATFSDIANEIATDHGFWLGDAFASGGSAGYDHKKMGITARGAWEAVKRHFRELDVDIQTTPFTAVGVGDMSGDVFGNGMLLSPATKLLAAFDHRDIFIDPAPDPAVSLAERQRLFDLPRSTWQDYDPDLISAGGGVFSRRAKSIPLTAEIRALLGLSGARTTPQELMRAILAAEVDLLWFGGIGTYVKAPDERDGDVGDRANDALRITSADVKARVVGEGANLGMTQRARIDYGLRGGRCNSDAIDNSAGVNTSDVEVNIKIALRNEMRSGDLTLPRRNRLLKAMTDNVAALVLANNYDQSLAISLSERQGMADFDMQHRFMRSLEREGRLDRQVEVLPDDVAMGDRRTAGQPLTRAEIGVVLAYAKITLYEDLLASDLADDPAFVEELMRYFPKRMQDRTRDAIEGHRLRREIIVTQLTNAIVNRCGPTFVMQVRDRTGASADQVVRAYVTAREVFGLRDLQQALDGLDNAIGGALQLALYSRLRDVARDRTVWFLGNAGGSVADAVARFGPAVARLAGLVDGLLPDRLDTKIAAETAELTEGGVPDKVAARLARLDALVAGTDVALVAETTGADLGRAAAAWFETGEVFRIARLREQAAGLSVGDYYDGLALDRASEALGLAHRELARAVVSADEMNGSVDTWLAQAGADAQRTLDAMAAMAESGDLTVSRVTVAAGLLADFSRQA